MIEWWVRFVPFSMAWAIATTTIAHPYGGSYGTAESIVVGVCGAVIWWCVRD